MLLWEHLGFSYKSDNVPYVNHCVGGHFGQSSRSEMKGSWNHFKARRILYSECKFLFGRHCRPPHNLREFYHIENVHSHCFVIIFGSQTSQLKFMVDLSLIQYFTFSLTVMLKLFLSGSDHTLQMSCTVNYHFSHPSSSESRQMCMFNSSVIKRQIHTQDVSRFLSTVLSRPGLAPLGLLSSC